MLLVAQLTHSKQPKMHKHNYINRPMETALKSWVDIITLNKQYQSTDKIAQKGIALITLPIQPAKQ